MKKTFSLILAVLTVLSVLALASCSGSDTPATTETTANASEGKTGTDTPAPTVEQPTDTTEATPTQPGSETPTETTTPEPAVKTANDAVAATLALGSYEAKMTIEETVADAVVSAEYDITVSADAAKSDRTVTAAGRSATVSVYSSGNDVYVKDAPEGAKASDYDVKSEIPAIVCPLPEEILAAAAVADGEGQKVLTASLTGEQFAACYPAFLNKLTASADQLAAGAAVSGANVEIAYNDYVLSYKVSFDMTVTSAGNTKEAKVVVTVSFTAPGEEKTVDAPSDLASYTKL